MVRASRRAWVGVRQGFMKLRKIPFSQGILSLENGGIATNIRKESTDVDSFRRGPYNRSSVLRRRVCECSALRLGALRLGG